MSTQNDQEVTECKFCSCEAMDELDVEPSKQDAFQHYCNYFHHHEEQPVMEKFEELYQGDFKTIGDFCEHLFSECDESYDNLTDVLKKCINWRAVWEWSIQYDYTYEHGHVFRTN